MAKRTYTAEEERFLQYPPTENTWICLHPATELSPSRRVPNSGNTDRCWACGRLKPSGAPLAWPIYQAALAKQEALSGS